jgi:hypothetical protein
VFHGFVLVEERDGAVVEAFGCTGGGVGLLGHFKEMPNRHQPGKLAYPLDETSSAFAYADLVAGMTISRRMA